MNARTLRDHMDASDAARFRATPTSTPSPTKPPTPAATPAIPTPPAAPPLAATGARIEGTLAAAGLVLAVVGGLIVVVSRCRRRV